MIRSKWCLFLVLFSFLLSGACVITLVDMQNEEAYLPAGNFHRYFSFKDDGVLSVSNMTGDVEIIGWNREGLDVYAEKMFRVPRTAMIQVFRKGLVPDIDIDKFENYIGIETETDHDIEVTGCIDYFLRVPHSINLDRIHLVDGNVLVSGVYGRSLLEIEKGNVEVENYSGSLTVYAGQGLVEVQLVDVRSEDRIALSVDNGEIMLFLEEEAQADIDASVLDGKIINEFDPNPQSPEDKEAYQLGQGGAKIFLSVSSGNITIKKQENTGD